MALRKWVASSSTDPFDDSRTVVLSLPSEPRTDGQGGGQSLTIRYVGGHSEVFIDWNVELGATAEVTWRVDSEPSQTGEWTESKDRRSTFCPADPVSFIRRLKDAETLITRVTSAGGEPITVRFDTRGLEETIARYAGDLGW